MKPQTIIRSSTAALLLFIATACGDSSSGPDYDETLSPGVAGDAGESVYDYAVMTFRSMNFGSPMVGIGAPAALTRLAAAPGGRPAFVPRFQFDLSSPATIRAGLEAAAGAGCSTVASGTDGGIYDPIDANENNVADDWSVKVTCVSYDSLGDSLTRVETEVYSIRIKEHTNDLFGFDASARSDDHEDYTNGDDEKQSYEQVHNVSVTATGATSKFTGRYTWDYLDDGVRESGERTFEVDLAFDPDGTITLESPGLPSGELTITGLVRFLDPEDGNTLLELSTPEPWIYSAECAASVEEQPFVDGTLLGLLNGNEEIGFSLVWGECGTGFDFSTFGLEAAPPAWSTVRARR